MVVQHSRVPAATSRWLVVPLATPRALRHCARCDEVRPFSSSDRFRINAHRRRLDVWLVYRCSRCEATWNRELWARVAPDDLAPGLLDRLHHNDRATAWTHAFDVAELARAGARVDAEVPYRVERAPLAGAGGLIVRIDLAYPCAVRLDRLLAAELGLSRAGLAAHRAAGRLIVHPDEPAALRRPARSGQLVELAPAILGTCAKPA